MSFLPLEDEEIRATVQGWPSYPSNAVDVPGTTPQDGVMRKLFDLPGRMLDVVFEPIFGPRPHAVPTSGQSQQTPTAPRTSWGQWIGSFFGDFAGGVLGPIFPMLIVLLLVLFAFLIVGKKARVL